MRRLALVIPILATVQPAVAADFSEADPPPTHAFGQVAGYLNLSAGYNWLNENGVGNYEIEGLSAEGRINLWLGPRTSTQVDAWGQEFRFVGDGDARTYGAALHGSWRDPSSYLFGSVVSIGSTYDFDYADVALEAQRYFGNFTLYTQAGYGWSYEQPGGRQTMPFVTLIGRYFTDPDGMLEGLIRYGHYHVEGVGSSEQIAWRTTLERRVPGQPFAGYLAYEGGWTSFSDRMSHGIFAGIKLIPNQSLETNDRSGATLLDTNPLFGLPVWY